MHGLHSKPGLFNISHFAIFIEAGMRVDNAVHAFVNWAGAIRRGFESIQGRLQSRNVLSIRGSFIQQLLELGNTLVAIFEDLAESFIKLQLMYPGALQSFSGNLPLRWVYIRSKCAGDRQSSKREHND